MKRNEKILFAQDLKGSFDGMTVMIVASYAGLSVAQMTALRVLMRKSQGSLKVAKNRIAKFAVQETPFQGVTEFLKGQTVIGFSQDPVAAARVMVDFSKDNPDFKILGGVMGSSVLKADSVMDLAKLPSLNELRGGILGLIQAPLAKLIRVAKAPGETLARVVDAYARKGAE